MNNVFGLDIGTRNVVGTVGYQTDDKEFVPWMHTIPLKHLR